MYITYIIHHQYHFECNIIQITNYAYYRVCPCTLGQLPIITLYWYVVNDNDTSLFFRRKYTHLYTFQRESTHINEHISHCRTFKTIYSWITYIFLHHYQQPFLQMIAYNSLPCSFSRFIYSQNWIHSQLVCVYLDAVTYRLTNNTHLHIISSRTTCLSLHAFCTTLHTIVNSIPIHNILYNIHSRHRHTHARQQYQRSTEFYVKTTSRRLFYEI